MPEQSQAGKVPSSPPAASPPAPDRPAERKASPGIEAGRLVGSYTRKGATLRRSDGLALVVCLSNRGKRSGRDSARYVSVARVGAGRPAYSGNLYADDATGRCDLDGCQFQDGRGGVRYRISLHAPGRYSVAPVVKSRQGRAGR